MNQQTRAAWITIARLSRDAQKALDGSGSIARDLPWPVADELIAARCVRRGGRVTPFGLRVGQAVRGELGAPPAWEALQ